MGILLSVCQPRQGQLRDIGMRMHMVCCSMSMMDQPISCDMLHGDEKAITLLSTSTLSDKRIPDFPITAGPLFLEYFSAFI